MWRRFTTRKPIVRASPVSWKSRCFFIEGTEQSDGGFASLRWRQCRGMACRTIRKKYQARFPPAWLFVKIPKAALSLVPLLMKDRGNHGKGASHVARAKAQSPPLSGIGLGIADSGLR